MRRSRRNGHAGMEFGGSGEDSFVAVVVTKLTGALLFILLLTMVIMALMPKAVDMHSAGTPSQDRAALPLAIATPERLPEAIAGHPYVVALAATGGRGPLKWSLDGKLPEGLDFDPASAQVRGTPRKGTPEPAKVVMRVSDGNDRASQEARLLVYESDKPLTTPSKWKPALPPVPWQAWLEQGFGFLMLWLIHAFGMNSLASLERRAESGLDDSPDSDEESANVRKRFLRYRVFTRLATFGGTVALALWLWRPIG
ncbi:putative Ig domain-containing protein [Singulisphaera rosea]